MARLLFAIATAFCVVAAWAQTSFGVATDFNRDWLFMLGDDAQAARTEYVDSAWRRLDLPHDWSIEGIPSPTLASCTGYLPAGVAWYRKHFAVSDLAQKHYIYFEGIYNRSEVFVNGQKIGGRPNGYVSFALDLTPCLHAGDNVIAVRVDHSRNADSRWYTGSGIYRNTWLVTANHTHIALWGVGYNATIRGSRATVDVDVAIENPQKGMTLDVRLADAEGKVVAKAKSPAKAANTLRLNVKNAHLWDINDTYLYSMTTSIVEKGRIIDQTVTKVGLRSLDFNPNTGFALNGRNMKVKGVCLHHDAGVLGAAVPEAVWERRLKTLNSMGVNAISTSHNPQAPIVYDLCDSIGLLVMDEISDEWEFPKRKWISGWNKGTPGFDGSHDFFEEWIERDVTDMVRRDRNHPCVFMWSIGNEVDYPNDPYSHPVLDGDSISQPMYGGYNPQAPRAERIGTIAKRLAKCVRAADSSRPVTGALAGVAMSNATEYPAAVDVVGYNYTENRYATDHATYPQRIIFGSENGRQLSSWRAVEDNDFIFGEFVWTGINYLGESRQWPSRGLGSGLLGFGGFLNPVGEFFKALWCDEPTAYIGTSKPKSKGYMQNYHIWNYAEGDTVTVTCFTNAASARLILNGALVGEQPYNREKAYLQWKIPFQPGTLRLDACDENGNVVATDQITSSLRPYALKASLIDSNKGISHVLVEVVDENGVLVTLADNLITCAANGPKILGIENSNNADMSRPTATARRAHHGAILAYTRGSGSLTFTSPLLLPATIPLP